MSDFHIHDDDATRLAAESARRLTDSGRNVLQFSLGLQRLLIEEMARASGEILERMHVEVEIASELVARVASAHSIRELAAAYNDCTQHQAEAFRIDSQLLMKHGQRLCDRTSRLLTGTAAA
jgi:hypothetical protein